MNVQRQGRWRVWPVLLTGVVAALVGCGKSPTTPTQPGIRTGTFNDLTAMISASFPSGAQLPTNLDTTANILAGINVDGISGSVALFPILSGGFITLSDAGTVTVRTGLGPAKSLTAMDKLQLNVAATIHTVYTTLLSHPLDLSLAFDGTTYHAFTTSGTGAVPAMNDSVKSVTLPTISAPTLGANVSRAADLTVSWGDAGTDSTVYIMAFVGSLVDTTKFAAAALTRDSNGSLNVPSVQLSLMPNGSAELVLVRFRLVRRNLAGRKIDLISEAVRRRPVVLVN